MNKTKIFLLTIFLIFIISISAIASNTMEFKWSQCMAPDHPWSVVGQMICDEINEVSNGRIKITQYPANTLGTEAEAADMLRMGSLAFLTSGPSVLSSFYEQVMVFGLPYIFRDREHAYKVIHSDIGQEIFNDIILSRSGIRTFDFWYFGDRVLTTKGIPVTKPSDLEGIKIRCMDYPLAHNVVRALGGSPTPVSFTELYLALQTGVVVGQENPISNIYASKFYEVQDHVIFTNHSIHMGTLHVSESIWKTIPEEDQQLILGVFEKYRPIIEEKIDEVTEVAIKDMKARGIKFIEPDLDSFKEYANKVLMEAYGDDPEWMSVINRIKAVN